MNVLYATDGSECAGTAGRLLSRLSLPEDARVTVLGAVPEPSWVATLPFDGVAAKQRAAALQTAEAAAASLREHGATVSACIWRQTPAVAILEQAREDQVELIVVGSHGKGAMQRLLLGSVSERVARYAHCSVLVARGDTLRRAIVAVDGSESAEHALDALLRLPLPAEMEMTLVHVCRPATLPPALQLGPDFSGRAMIAEYERHYHSPDGQIVRHALAHLRHAGREAATDVRCGAPAEELIAAAREADVDLIVVGAANKSALGRPFLGSVSGRVLSHAPCSVLVARGDGKRCCH